MCQAWHSSVKEYLFTLYIFDSFFQAYGWCYTDKNYYNFDTLKKDSIGWGFCSRDCFLDKNEKPGGILRIVDHVNILPGTLCDGFLERSLRFGNKTSYRPKILCVGKVHHWNTDVWGLNNHIFMNWTGYGNIDEIVRKHHYGERLGFGGYVASAGTCSGDSGGPVYQEQIDIVAGKIKYVVTGSLLYLHRK